VREYFLEGPDDGKERPFQLNEQTLEWRAAQTCLNYLSDSDFNHTWISVNAPEVMKQRPFLAYATLYWTSHAQQSSGPNLDLVDTTHPFLQDTKSASVLRMNWLLSYLLHSKLFSFVHALSLRLTTLPLLELAARFGLVA
jgi:hypothetical protein